MATNTGMKEYWVMHRPRHPIWGGIMFGSTGATTVASPVSNITTQLYDGSERDYLFYKYSPASGSPSTFAVTEKPWLQHTICYSMEDAILAAKRLISYVGQDNVRICRVINGTLDVKY